MQVTAEEILAEAQAMALEIRLKERVIVALQARVAELEAACPGTATGDDAASALADEPGKAHP